jgi:predicted acylesterase/phospholipase RssA
LNENNYIDNIIRYSGCSIGSILCTLLCIGYKIEEIKKISYELNISELLNDFNIDLLIEHKCIYNNLKLSQFIKKLIKNKTNNEDFTFK